MYIYISAIQLNSRKFYSLSLVTVDTGPSCSAGQDHLRDFITIVMTSRNQIILLTVFVYSPLNRRIRVVSARVFVLY